MPKFALWVAVLTLSVGANAQTVASLRNELIDMADTVLDLYSDTNTLRYSSGPAQSECLSIGNKVIDIGDKIKAYIDRTKPFFESNANEQYFYVRQASGALFSAATSTLTALNKICSANPTDREVGALYLQIADLKLDMFGMHLWKADR